MQTGSYIWFIAVFAFSCAAHASEMLYRREVNELNPGGKDLVMVVEELERNKTTSLVKVTYDSGASVPSVMFVKRCFYEMACARKAKYFVTLRATESDDGDSIYLVGFCDSNTVSRKDYFELPDEVELARNEEFWSVAEFELFFDGGRRLVLPSVVVGLLRAGYSVSVTVKSANEQPFLDGPATAVSPDKQSTFHGFVQGDRLLGSVFHLASDGSIGVQTVRDSSWLPPITEGLAVEHLKVMRLGLMLSAFLEDELVLSLTLGASERGTMLHGPLTVAVPSGSVIVRGGAVDGRFSGDWLSFDDSGVLRHKEVYREGMNVGEQTFWNALGEVTRIRRYSGEGQLHGWDRYFAEGQIVRAIKWNEGTAEEMREYEDGILKRSLGSGETRAWLDERFRRRKAKNAQPGATDNPDDVQRLREDH